jgi:SAM-dependent methyltransferase
MDTKNAIVLYEWILQEFTLDRRAGFVNSLAPYLTALLHPGDRVLDLCCGAGPFSFFFEEQAARVTRNTGPRVRLTSKSTRMPPLGTSTSTQVTCTVRPTCD